MIDKRSIPKILISNDDGIHAKGMNMLIDALRPFADITVVAPDGPRSGASSSITTQVPLEPIKMREEPGLSYYRTMGTPADCVKLALNLLFQKEKPTLVVTGINHGRNDGICVIYSGTIGAAQEACIAGVPALAVSLNNHDAEADMTYAIEYACRIVRHILEEGWTLPPYAMLSLNIPNQKPKGLKVCPQAVTHFVEEYAARDNGRGKTVYWMTGYQEKSLPTRDTDFDYLSQGYATLTPLQLDLTHYELLDPISKEFAPLIDNWDK